MICTIKVKFDIALDEEMLQKNDWVRHTISKGEYFHRIKYTLNITTGEIKKGIKLTYYPQDIRDEPISSCNVEFSAPKLIYGNNVKMITDISAAILEINEKLLEFLPPYISVDISKSELLRLDLCWNYMVGKRMVMEYIEALSKLHLGNRVVKCYTNYLGRRQKNAEPNDVRFEAASIRTLFYDKFLESGLPEASGTLRHEISIRRKGTIGILFGINVTLMDIDNQAIIDLLNSDLEKLGVNLPIPNGKDDQTLQILIGNYGASKGTKLDWWHDYFCKNGTKNTDEIAKALNHSPQGINKIKRDIIKAGVPLTETNSDRQLPPLSIPRISDTNEPVKE